MEMWLRTRRSKKKKTIDIINEWQPITACGIVIISIRIDGGKYAATQRSRSIGRKLQQQHTIEMEKTIVADIRIVHACCLGCCALRRTPNKYFSCNNKKNNNKKNLFMEYTDLETNRHNDIINTALGPFAPIALLGSFSPSLSISLLLALMCP